MLKRKVRIRTLGATNTLVFKTSTLNHSVNFPSELQSSIYELYVVVFVLATEYLVVTEHPSYCWVDKSLT